MPTKRTAGAGRIGDLSPALVDVLLTGDSPLDRFLIFEVDLLEDGDYLPRLYREHQGALDAEWARRGGTGAPWIGRDHFSPLKLVAGQWVKSTG